MVEMRFGWMVVMVFGYNHHCEPEEMRLVVEFVVHAVSKNC